jgi:hypothetical protein
MSDKIQIRRDTGLNWILANPILADGEIAFEKDTNRFKVGNGNATWSALPYMCREALYADRTYYVSTTGSDENDGLSSSLAFASIQRAVNAIDTLDIGNYNVTIEVADGTYTTNNITLNSYVGRGTVKILGNSANPSSVTLTNGFTLQGGTWLIEGVKISTSGDAFAAFNYGVIQTKNIEIGNVGTGRYGFYTSRNGVIMHTNNLYVSGNGGSLVFAIINGSVVLSSTTITFKNPVTWSNLLYVSGSSTIWFGSAATIVSGNNFTGKSYNGAACGSIVLAGTTLPGTPGTVASGAAVI